MLISVLKEKFAFASTPEERLEVINQHTVPESKDWYYYRGLMILQELNTALTSKLTSEEGLLTRTPDPREAQLMGDMSAHLLKCKALYPSIYSQLEARFKLLSYPVNSADSIEYMRRELQIHAASGTSESLTSPAPKARGRASMYPTRLDESMLDPRLVVTSAKGDGKDLNPLLIPTLDDDDCIENLLKIPQQRADLVILVANMIRNQKNPDLRMLTLEQLEELRRLVPNVIENKELGYVGIFLQKLVPAQDGAAEDWNLDRIWRFVDTLEGHQKLKTTVLCYRLLDYVVRGRFDQWELFEKLYLANTDAQSAGCANDDDSIIPGLDNNLPGIFCSLLYQEFIMGALRQSGVAVLEKLERLPRYATELKNLHARLILTCSPPSRTEDAVNWAKKVLGQDAIDDLAKEVELRFPFATLESKTIRAPQLLPSDSIRLTVRVKNIKQITVRAYQMDLFQYWRQQKLTHLDVADVKLDGLCPNWEKDFDTGHLSPLERFDMVLDLSDPSIFASRGIWVIDVVGGRESCRAIVQKSVFTRPDPSYFNKGRLRHLVKDTSAGHLFCIVDESNTPVKAKIWFQNQYYEADENNNILIPYGSSTQVNARALAVTEDDGYCEPILFTHKVETYDLKAVFFVHPENLIANKQTKARHYHYVLVTLNLSIYQQDVSLDLLEPLSLTVTACNARGIKSIFTRDKIPVPKKRNEPIEFTFTVPTLRENFGSVASLDFVLKTKAKTTSVTRPFQELQSSDSLQFKTVIDSITSAYLRVLDDGNYAIQILYKNGDVQPNAVVDLQLDHIMARSTIGAKLQTDQDGLVHLGKLPYVTSIEVMTPLKKKWNLLPSHTKSTLPSTLYYPANTPFKLPYAAGMCRKCTLFQTGYSGAILHDLTDKLKPTDEVIEVQGLPTGRYVFYLALPEGTACFGVHKIELMTLDATSKIDTSPHWSNWLLDRGTFAQSTGNVIQKPMAIRNLEFTESEVIVDLDHTSPSTTVAFLSLSAFVPPPLIDPASLLATHIPPSPVRLNCSLNTYKTFLEGRKLSQEFEYVLNRIRAEKWVGSMLHKPSMVMYPKANKITATEARFLEDEEPHTKQSVAATAFGGPRMFRSGARMCRMVADDGGDRGEMWNDFDFLNHRCPIVAVVPDSHGRIAVQRSSLGDGNILHLVVCQGKQTLVKQLTFPGSNQSIKTVDLSHSGHDPKIAYIRSKSVAKLLEPSESLELDMTQHEWEIVSSLEKVFDHFCMATEFSLEDFRFLNTWHSMPLAQKLKKHQEMVCHELNLWLKFKDPAFFDAYVKPSIKSKLRKSFMDTYLLDEDLTMYANDICLYGTLSMIEKALLAKRMPELLPVTLKEFQGVYQPPSEKTMDRQFEMILARGALRSSAYDSDSYADENEDADDDMGFALVDAPGGASYLCAAAPKLQSCTEIMKEYAKAMQTFNAEAGMEDDERQFKEDQALRNALQSRRVKQPYTFIEATREWEEKGYYNDKASSARVNAFWIDYLQSTASPFLSGNFIYAHADLTEVLAVLALTDLPLDMNACVRQEIDPAKFKLFVIPETPCLVYYRALQIAQTPAPPNPTILLGQGFFVKNGVSKEEEEEDLEMVDPSDLEPSVEYGWNLAISNISSTCCTAEVTFQIPLGSIPTGTTPYIQSHTIQIKPYSTWRNVVGSFYFSKPGEYDHAPVTVSKASTLYGQTSPLHITVSKKDKNLSHLLASSSAVSWTALTAADSGVTDADILNYLKHKADLQKVDLKLLDWRMRNPEFAKQVLQILRDRMFFCKELWQYGFQHCFSDAIREYLLKAGECLFAKCGGVVETPLVSNTIIQEPVKILDYFTMIGARVHSLGSSQIEIFDKDFFRQYDRFLDYLAHVRSPSSEDIIMQTVYLILQDRIGEAHRAFQRLQSYPDVSGIQADYLRAYLETRVKGDLSYTDMATLDLGTTRDIVLKYKTEANQRWREMFDSLGKFLDEVERPLMTPTEEQTMSPAQLEADIHLEIDERAGQLCVAYANVTELQIRYYKMDVEVMFSMNPFMVSNIHGGRRSRHHSSLSVQYEWIKPIHVENIKLQPQTSHPQQQEQPCSTNDAFEVIGAGRVLTPEATHHVAIPTELRHQNCVIHVRTSTGLERQKAYFSHNMIVHPIESRGVVRVMTALKDHARRPLAGAYVKVYAKLKNEEVHFWKDGYTGLNGLFDYVSVTNGNALLSRTNYSSANHLETVVADQVEMFSILISSLQHGALVEEVLPPRC
ncbi:hypothetical protein BX666DRAFT_1880893 [Dichotomocladium elegans]|nr:hypothetical protein BX666DRAFT_1880893 [Dichotomocladium elegans]